MMTKASMMLPKVFFFFFFFSCSVLRRYENVVRGFNKKSFFFFFFSNDNSNAVPLFQSFVRLPIVSYVAFILSLFLISLRRLCLVTGTFLGYLYL